MEMLAWQTPNDSVTSASAHVNSSFKMGDCLCVIKSLFSSVVILETAGLRSVLPSVLGNGNTA